MRSDPAPTIGLLSPSGWGNLGDAAIQDVTISAIRSRRPGAQIVAFTLNPEDTERRHGIPARPLSGYAPPGYSITGRRLFPPTARPLSRLLAPLGPVARLADFFQGEPPHLALAARWVRRVELLIASGGGQLDDFWGGAWGHPYALWKWKSLARIAGTPLVLLSVGVGTLRTPLARLFVKRVLQDASYFSFRDSESAARAARTVSTSDAARIVPDLAFGLRPEVRALGRGRIGLSPIAYQDPRVWPQKDAGGYRRYVERLAAVLQAWVAAGDEVVLFTTDSPDRLVMDDVWNRAGQPPQVRRADTRTTGALFEELAAVDVVVASRLHGVVLAHLAGRPTVALSYDWKVARHMREADQAEHCLDIDTFQPDVVVAAVRRLRAESASARRVIGERVEDCRRQVERQFDEVLR